MHDLQRRAGPRSNDLKIGYIGGGSRGFGVDIINDLAQAPDINGEVYLYDVDDERARRNEEFGNWVQDHEEAVGDVTYRATGRLGTALDGADFVVISTQDPPGETYVHDLDIPLEYGIHQTVGDTVGPGGALRAMRTIPPYREFAAAIREHAPDAWVISYTNPMSVCTRTLYREYPGINAVGLCHGVFQTQQRLATLVGRHLDRETPPRDRIAVNVKGINHFTWIDEAYWRDQPLLPLVEAELAANDPDPYARRGPREGSPVDEDPIYYDLFETFGLLPGLSARHVSEFVPWYLNVDSPEEVHRWGFELNDSETWLADWQERNDQRDRLYGMDEPFEFYDSGEEAIPLMRALLGGDAIKTNVNLPNRGQTPDMPEGAVVETNALVTGDAVTPLCAGTLPRQLRNIVLTHVHNQETLVEAGFEGDPDIAFRAFLNDPLVAPLTRAQARALFDDLVDAQRSYLKDWEFERSGVV